MTGLDRTVKPFKAREDLAFLLCRSDSIFCKVKAPVIGELEYWSGGVMERMEYPRNLARIREESCKGIPPRMCYLTEK